MLQQAGQNLQELVGGAPTTHVQPAFPGFVSGVFDVLTNFRSADYVFCRSGMETRSTGRDSVYMQRVELQTVFGVNTK